MYVLLLLQVFKSSCNCRKLLYCSRLSKLFNADNQTAIAARPCTVGVSLLVIVKGVIEWRQKSSIEDWSIEPFQKETGDIAETEPATQPLTQPIDDRNGETTEPEEGESVNPPGSSNRCYPTRIRRAPNRPRFISY